MYYRNRMYHTQLGRIVSRDPVGYLGDDLNVYRYVDDTPLNASDPHGLERWVRITEHVEIEQFGGIVHLTLPGNYDQGDREKARQATLEAWGKFKKSQPATFDHVIRDRRCPEGYRTGKRDRHEHSSQENTSVRMVYVVLKKKLIGGGYKAEIVGPGTPEADVDRRGTILLESKWKADVEYESGPCCKDDRTSCDSEIPKGVV